MVVDNIAIILCTIPKGTKYYVNSVGEIASNSLHVHKVLKKPFTFNVDGEINKNSVNKINALLNQWETLVILNNKLCNK
jgi:homogentisate 1,2-dioxygenase